MPVVTNPYQALNLPDWRTISEIRSLKPSRTIWGAKTRMIYGMYERSFINVLKAAEGLSGGMIRDARVNENGGVDVAISQNGDTKWVTLGSTSISGGASRSLHIDICLAVAAARAREKVTLLTLDSQLDGFDRRARAAMFARLTDQQWPFQIVITSVDEESVASAGAMWLVTHLRRHDKSLFSVDQRR